jgi:hypothetical protein
MENVYAVLSMTIENVLARIQTNVTNVDAKLLSEYHAAHCHLPESTMVSLFNTLCHLMVMYILKTNR